MRTSNLPPFALIGILAACGGSGETSLSGATVTSASSSSGTGGGAGGEGGQGGQGGQGGSGGSGGSMPTKCPGTGPNGYNPYKLAYYGDLHLHTSFSLDSFSFGNRNDPSTAYLFAKGAGKVDIGSGATLPGPAGVTQKRPLDFLAVTDHSEWLEITHGCVVDPASPYYGSNSCLLVRSTKAAAQDTVFASLGTIDKQVCGANDDSAACVAERRSAWQDLQDAAKKAYDPCKFTSLVAYEWTAFADHSYVDNGMMVSKNVTNHRNVIFGSDVVPDEPLSFVHYPKTTDLWNGLESECTNNASKAGCDVVTIPHNTNLSAGESLDISAVTATEIEQRQKFQVSAEIYQHKGASECFYDPSQGYSDPDCQFEMLTAKEQTDPQPMAYLREGLAAGIGYASSHPGEKNPLELGFVGATDDHDGAPGNVDEAAFVGHAGRSDDHPALRIKATPTFGPGAVTGAWAEENTRDSIFGAIKRRETFATSGPRIALRFYQTSDAMACADPDFPKKIIDAGTGKPMGSEVRMAEIAGGKALFAVSAWPDPVPQNLADDTSAVAGFSAVQVIKAHVKQGTSAVVEDPPVVVAGIGAMGGCAVWQDDAFDATEYAVYYVRALQVPTWRWSHYDCAALEKKDPNWMTNFPECAPGGTMDVSIKERAWTSPIWFSPN